MLPYAATLLLLATAVCARTQPDYSGIDLGNIPTPQEIMVVMFPNEYFMNYGNNCTKDTLYAPPRVAYLVKDSGFYAYAGLVLAGADDPQCPGKQTLLSLQININGSKTDTTGDEVSPYEAPNIVKISDVLYVTVRQNAKIEKDALSELSDVLGNLLESRNCFSFFDDFMKPNGITQVYAGNWGRVLPVESEPDY